MLTCADYEPGHCWYYRLKGKPFGLKAILEYVKERNYFGYDEECVRKIDSSAKDAHQKLAELRQKRVDDLKSDVNTYRKYLVRYAKCKTVASDDMCMDLCVALSLKFCHIYNRFGSLLLIDELLKNHQVQGDLFGF